jgi:hypothetical protein
MAPDLDQIQVYHPILGRRGHTNSLPYGFQEGF